jgi:hypothetical protein
VDYQSLHRADRQRGQRNFPEGLFVIPEIKRSAGMNFLFFASSFLLFYARQNSKIHFESAPACDRSAVSRFSSVSEPPRSALIFQRFPMD